MRDISASHHQKYIKSIAQTVLGSVIDVKQFEKEGLLYLDYIKEEISINVSFILS